MNSDQLHFIFGTGAVGMALMEALCAEGQTRIRMINPSGRADVPPGIEVRAGDVTDRAFARAAAQGAAVVYNCTNPPYHRWPELIPPLWDGIMDAAAFNGARLVVMDNLYMYGDPDGAPITEAMPYAAHTVKGKVRAEAARKLEAAHARGDVQMTMGRASDYFGPRGLEMSMIGSRAMYPALAGKPAQVLFDIDQPHTYTYLPDIGRALAALGAHESALGRSWIIPSPRTTTTREILSLAYREAGHELKVEVMPRWMQRAVGLFVPALREMQEMRYEFDKPFIVDGTAFTGQFGLAATPLEQAVSETVNWFRAHPAR